MKFINFADFYSNTTFGLIYPELLYYKYRTKSVFLLPFYKRPKCNKLVLALRYVIQRPCQQYDKSLINN